MKSALLALAAAVMSAFLAAPGFSQDEHAAAVGDTGIQMIARTTQAVDYRRGDHTDIELAGTDLLPAVTGTAKIINKRGLTDIHVDVANLRSANALDATYLTYVLWAVSPQGMAQNIGELVEKNGKASLHTTTNLQAFALVVTAEPDFAVSQPSELVVAENRLSSVKNGTIVPINVHYQVFPRSVYLSQAVPAPADIYRDDKNAPLDLLEARNAVRIAEANHAGEYASDALQRAHSLLQDAEENFNAHHSSKTVETAARSAVQSAEEARALGIRGEHQARLQRERQEAQERTENAQNQAASAQIQAQQAEAERRAAEQRAQAEQQHAQEAQQQAQDEAARRAQLEQQNEQTQQQAQQAQQEADLQRQQAQQAQQQAQDEAARRAAAEQQAQQSGQQVDEARRQAQEAQQRAQQAETQQQQLRDQLRQQLNQILETRDTARGLIVSMPDVLFDTGSATPKATARERLAKVSGILIAHPDIRVEVDGYTDSTGEPTFNQQLSEHRAAAVQTYLAQQGVPGSSISIHGFGQADPIASNDTAAGRQQNRRVELVVSGESIGNQVGEAQ
jgi:outer membrane protein OmpA-like peptidoglycan-associated protein